MKPQQHTTGAETHSRETHEISILLTNKILEKKKYNATHPYPSDWNKGCAATAMLTCLVSKLGFRCFLFALFLLTLEIPHARGHTLHRLTQKKNKKKNTTTYLYTKTEQTLESFLCRDTQGKRSFTAER